MRMIVSSQGIAVKVWRNCAVSCGAMRVFPSDTILAALGDVSSNPSFFLNVPHLSARARPADFAVQRTVMRGFCVVCRPAQLRWRQWGSFRWKRAAWLFFTQRGGLGAGM
jgi:hypothetical protein